VGRSVRSGGVVRKNGKKWQKKNDGWGEEWRGKNNEVVVGKKEGWGECKEKKKEKGVSG